MCTLVLAIISLVFGIVVLATGRVKLSSRRVVTGAPARVIGVILIMPLPLMFAGGVVLGLVLAAQGALPNPETVHLLGALIEIGVLAACVVLTVVIGANYSHPPERRLKYEDDFDDEDEYRDRPPLPDEGRFDDPEPPWQKPDDRFRP